MAADSTESLSLEYTPTWVVAVVCSIIVLISICMERLLHRLGKWLKSKKQEALFDALQKIKEELMLLGFISLLLTVCQIPISHICIPSNASIHMLPCKRLEIPSSVQQTHYQETFSPVILGIGRRLLSEGAVSGHCSEGKSPLLSIEALHQLHIFIFVLAVVHCVFCVTTMFLGGAKIRHWKRWEDSIRKTNEESKNVPAKGTPTPAHHRHHKFLKEHVGFWTRSTILTWTVSFFKQFHDSVSKSDYMALRYGFINNHCPSNQNFDFHQYMMRTLESDFKRVVGISWYLWLFVVIFMLLNVEGWHAYFWLSFLPLILLVTVGAKLEHVITRLAQDFAEKQVAEQAHTGVKPTDEHFWFGRPKIILYLIHFILFQNSFEIAFFFWIWSTYGFDSCIMEKVAYIVPRLIFGVIIQVLCSYSTLPLYAIVTQMGTMYKPEIFQEHLSTGIHEWAEGARIKKEKTSIFKKFFGRGKSEDDHSVLEMKKMATETNANNQSVILEGITTIAESSDSDN